MEFGQLIEYDMRNLFLGKSHTKYGAEIIPRIFPKEPKLGIFLDQKSKVLYSLFLLWTKLRTIDKY